MSGYQYKCNRFPMKLSLPLIDSPCHPPKAGYYLHTLFPIPTFHGILLPRLLSIKTYRKNLKCYTVVVAAKLNF